MHKNGVRRTYLGVIRICAHKGTTAAFISPFSNNLTRLGILLFSAEWKAGPRTHTDGSGVWRNSLFRDDEQYERDGGTANQGETKRAERGRQDTQTSSGAGAHEQGVGLDIRDAKKLKFQCSTL